MYTCYMGAWTVCSNSNVVDAAGVSASLAIIGLVLQRRRRPVVELELRLHREC